MRRRSDSHLICASSTTQQAALQLRAIEALPWLNEDNDKSIRFVLYLKGVASIPLTFSNNEQYEMCIGRLSA
jgi:hypothetical protein